MFKLFPHARAVLAMILLISPLPVLAQETLEGVVASTKLTACQFKPGGCAGSLVLEVQRDGKAVQVPLKVPLGTPIKRGSEFAYLPSLRGYRVVISQHEENGENVAKSIDVVASGKP
jgi:hypothetical protein